MTERIWDGKYKNSKKQGPVRIALPFQTIETVNESEQDRRRNLELFASGRDTYRRSRLVWGTRSMSCHRFYHNWPGTQTLFTYTRRLNWRRFLLTSLIP